VSNEQCTQNFYIHYEKRKQLEINVKLIIQLNYQPKQVGILRTKSAGLVRKIPVERSAVRWSIGPQSVRRLPAIGKRTKKIRCTC